jgi:hypothetical protein
MSRRKLDELLQRLIGDNEFRRDFDRERESVLDAFDLTKPEREYASGLNTADLVSSVTAIVPSGPRTVAI